MIFAVFDVLLAVNMCINYSFFTFIMYIRRASPPRPSIYTDAFKRTLRDQINGHKTSQSWYPAASSTEIESHLVAYIRSHHYFLILYYGFSLMYLAVNKKNGQRWIARLCLGAHLYRNSQTDCFYTNEQP